MGLDMYLSKRKKGVKIDKNESYESWKSRRIGYWRKANQIHKWFVDTVQDGNDDCGEYVVTRDNLMQLRDICYRIIAETKLVDTGRTEQLWDVDLHKEVEKPVMVIDDDKLCEELLPTQDGFFFGSCEYDEWYFRDVLDTYTQLTKVLVETDFDEDEIYYSSSW